MAAQVLASDKVCPPLDGTKVDDLDVEFAVENQILKLQIAARSSPCISTKKGKTKNKKKGEQEEIGRKLA